MFRWQGREKADTGTREELEWITGVEQAALSGSTTDKRRHWDGMREREEPTWKIPNLI